MATPATNFLIFLGMFVLGAFTGRLTTIVVNRITERIKPDGDELVFGSMPGSDTTTSQISNIRLLFPLDAQDPCKKRFNLTDLINQLLSGVLTIVLFCKFGATLTFLIYFIFFIGLIAIFRMDLEMMIIPDSISLTWLGLGLGAASIGLLPGINWKTSILGIFFGWAILYIPAKIYEQLKGAQGLGGGDVKLLAMIGAFVSIEGVIFTLFLGALTGYLMGILTCFFKKTSKSDMIPFGPYLTFSAILYILIGTDLINLLTVIKLPF